MHLVTFAGGGKKKSENAKQFSWEGKLKTQSNILRNCIYVAPISFLLEQNCRRRHKFDFEGLVVFLHAISQEFRK